MPTTFNQTCTATVGVTPTLSPSHSTPGTSNDTGAHRLHVPTRPFVILDDDLNLDFLTGQEPMPDTEGGSSP